MYLGADRHRWRRIRAVRWLLCANVYASAKSRYPKCLIFSAWLVEWKLHLYNYLRPRFPGESGWLIRDIYARGYSSRRLAYIVFNDDWRQANEYLIRHRRWYNSIVVLVPVFFALSGFLVFRKWKTRTGPLHIVMGALLVPIGLGAGVEPRIHLPLPLRDFFEVIALQRADVRFERAHLDGGEFPAAGRRPFPAKAWVHQTNSVEKLNALFNKSGGFELDVVSRSWRSTPSLSARVSCAYAGEPAR